MITRSILTLFLVFLLSPSQYGQELQTFKVYFKDYTKENGSCWDSADALAQKFTSLTQISAQGVCVSEKKFSYHIELEYEAEKPLEETHSNILLGNPLKYKDLAECSEELKEQEKNFIEQTGLTPLAFYCTQISYAFATKTEFEIQFLALGEAKVKPFFL